MALSGSFYEYPTSQFGLYCEWSGVQSISGNYTDITLKVYLHIWDIYVSARDDSTISINGVSETYTVPAISDSTNSWHYVLLKSKTVRVYHNSDGTKTGVALSASWRFSGKYSGVSIGRITASTTINLDSIDRTAPTVSCSISDLTTSSVKITATSNVNCNIWQYSTNGGSSWTQFSTTNGKSASVNVTGLSSTTYSVKVRARKTSNEVYGLSGTVTADLIAPVVSLSLSGTTVSSVTITATSNVNCNIWQYSTNGGSSWTQFSTTNGTSAATTVTGLSPNTTYSVRVRARKTSNSIYGSSSTQLISTLGASILNSVAGFDVDVASPVISLNWTVYNSTHYHKLLIKNGGTTVLTINGITGAVGTSNKTISLSSSQRSTILNAMSSIKSLNATFALETYTTSGYSVKIGDTSTQNASISTTSAVSAPSFSNTSGFTYSDTNSITVSVTGDNQIFIKNQSFFTANVYRAVAKNGASITEYSVKIGDKIAKSSNYGEISFGKILSYGSNVSVIVTAIDSRGYSVSVTKQINVIDYSPITIDEYALRRENDVGETVQLGFAGSLSPIYVNSVKKNSVRTLRYRSRKTGGSYNGWISLTPVESARGFSFNTEALKGSGTQAYPFDPDYSYELQIQVDDVLTRDTITIVLTKGTPLVALRSQRVGINNPDPQSALDVNGNIMMNGYNVQGYIGAVASGSDLNNILVSGIYYVPLNNTIVNRPQTNAVAVLEVIEVTSTFLLQRFTCVDGKVYCRGKYNTTWHDWA